MKIKIKPSQKKWITLFAMMMLLSSCGGGGTSEDAENEDQKPEVKVEETVNDGQVEKEKDADADSARVGEESAGSERERVAPTLVEAQKGFLQFCRESWTVPSEIHTIEQVGQTIGAVGCDAIAEKLPKVKHLNLASRQIKNLAPLAYFNALETLSLESNLVDDVAPIETLKNLQFLDLSKNEIKDVARLAGLTSLRALILSNNAVDDLSPLESLLQLQIIHFNKTNPIVIRKTEVQDPEKEECKDGYLVNRYGSCRHAGFGVELYRIGQGTPCGLNEKETQFERCRSSEHGFENSGRWERIEETRDYIDIKERVETIEDARQVARETCTDFFDRKAPARMRRDIQGEWKLVSAETHYLFGNDDPKVLPGNKVRINRISCWIYFQKRLYKMLSHSVHCPVKKAVWKVCRAARFGVEMYKSGRGPQCGVTGELFVDSRSVVKDIEAGTGSVLGCSTCANMIVNDSLGVARKLQCLGVLLRKETPKKLRDSAIVMLDDFFATKAQYFTEQQLQAYIKMRADL